MKNANVLAITTNAVIINFTIGEESLNIKYIYNFAKDSLKIINFTSNPKVNKESLKIGSLELRNEALFLAPMEDVTDHSFRLLCKEYGADFLYTEFVSAEGLIRKVNKTINKMSLFEAERPIGIQLYGSKIDSMVEAAKIAGESKPDIIDLNFGCPVRKIANKGGGAGMLKDIPKMIEMTKAVVNATNIPVTVKTRLGWDDGSKIIVDLAERLQDSGIKALTIHGRTRAQMYSGNADWTLIGEVKNNPRMFIPIIGNGDVDSGETARKMFDNYGVDGIMIGRSSIGNPYIFKEIRHFLDTGENLPRLNIHEQINNLKLLVSRSIEWNGLPGGILHMRRHMALNFKALPDFKPLRIKMLRCLDKDILWDIFDEIEKKYS